MLNNRYESYSKIPADVLRQQRGGREPLCVKEERGGSGVNRGKGDDKNELRKDSGARIGVFGVRIILCLGFILSGGGYRGRGKFPNP